MSYENNTFDDAGYGQYLLKSRIIHSGVEKYYISWVRSFFKMRHEWTGYDLLLILAIY